MVTTNQTFMLPGAAHGTMAVNFTLNGALLSPALREGGYVCVLAPFELAQLRYSAAGLSYCYSHSVLLCARLGPAGYSTQSCFVLACGLLAALLEPLLL